MVTKHGFLGALIHGHIRGRYLDDQFFWPVFEMAEKLDVPIYLHSISFLHNNLSSEARLSSAMVTM